MFPHPCLLLVASKGALLDLRMAMGAGDGGGSRSQQMVTAGTMERRMGDLGEWGGGGNGRG